MSYAPAHISQDKIAGMFVEKDHGKTFEYMNATAFPEDKFRDYKHLVFVGPNQETRFALVKKTVAYIVTDETETGLVVEKWNINRKWSR